VIAESLSPTRRLHAERRVHSFRLGTAAFRPWGFQVEISPAWPRRVYEIVRKPQPLWFAPPGNSSSRLLQIIEFKYASRLVRTAARYSQKGPI